MDKEISLTIETSGLIGSIALARDNDILEELVFSAPLRHGAETLPGIDILFRKHENRPDELDVLYISAGPGSFTGIRLAVTMAKTIAYATKARIVAVPSLEAQVLNAQVARQDGIPVENISVVLEAGRGKVFAATYKYCQNSHISGPDKVFTPDFIELSGPVMLSPAELLSQTPRPLYITGEGLNYHADEFIGTDIVLLDKKYHQTRAEYVFACGRLRRNADLFTDFESFTPFYMRKPEAELKLLEL